MENAITAARILKELGAIAFARATDFLSVRDGVLSVADTEALPEESACAIASVEKSAGSIKVKFYDKLKALELLGKHLGLFDGGAETQDVGGGVVEALLEQTGKELDTDDIPEIQQAAECGHDMVEQTRSV